eukprot:NODE_67_length_25542_cov_1.476831.p13 type:complete len:250 gc:universal NODE_67_length_25542_cov_1.476831:3759-3010(-)
MIMGVDVCHGNEIGARQGDSSVATFVGTVNARFYDYRHVYKNVDGEDTSEVVESAATELLEEFKVAAGRFPQNLVIFRDGLSEGQFETFGVKEIKAFKAAAKALNISDLKLVFISCIKRHQTRFFAERPGPNMTSRNGNLKNGLVVDSEITGKFLEFYLQSHNGLQGTAIPSRYVVLHDDCHVDVDELQKLTLTLCYTFQRSAAPTSIPDVVKRADLLAERIKRYEKTTLPSGDPVKISPELLKRAFYC